MLSARNRGLVGVLWLAAWCAASRAAEPRWCDDAPRPIEGLTYCHAFEWPAPAAQVDQSVGTVGPAPASAPPAEERIECAVESLRHAPLVLRLDDATWVVVEWNGDAVTVARLDRMEDLPEGATVVEWRGPSRLVVALDGTPLGVANEPAKLCLDDEADAAAFQRDIPLMNLQVSYKRAVAAGDWTLARRIARAIVGEAPPTVLASQTERPTAVEVAVAAAAARTVRRIINDPHVVPAHRSTASPQTRATTHQVAYRGGNARRSRDWHAVAQERITYAFRGESLADVARFLSWSTGLPVYLAEVAGEPAIENLRVYAEGRSLTVSAAVESITASCGLAWRVDDDTLQIGPRERLFPAGRGNSTVSPGTLRAN